MEFSKRLKFLRESKGMLQEELADVLGIPRSSITNYESEDNVRLPRNQRLQNIASFFNVSVDYLLGRDDSAYINSSPDDIKDVISKFENIEDIIRDCYLINFKQSYKDMDDYIKQEEQTLEDLSLPTNFSDYEKFNTPEEIYDSLTFGFKIRYLQAMIYDARIKKISFEDYLRSTGVRFKLKETQKNIEIDNALNQVEVMLKRTHEFIQRMGRIQRVQDEGGVDEKVVQLPIYGTIKAGYDYVAEQNIVGYKVAAKREVSDGDYFYLIVHGDSMIDEGIREGFHVLVRKQNHVENGKIGVVIVNGDEATLKRVYYDGNNIILQAANKNIPPRVLLIQDVQIQGQVKSVVFDV